MLTAPDAVHVTEIDGGSDVRVWWARLDLLPASHEALVSMLSPEERARAASYPSAVRGARFAAARGILRQLLQDATGVPARTIHFDYNADGKPCLGGDLASSGVTFNLSHARDAAAFVVAEERAVGIDLAITTGVAPIDNLVARYFSPEEREAVFGGDAGTRRERFARIWVRKEAYLKARGEGISQWVRSTDFSVLPGGAPKSAQPRVARDQDAWDVRDLRGLPLGLVGSVALSRRP